MEIADNVYFNITPYFREIMLLSMHLCKWLSADSYAHIMVIHYLCLQMLHLTSKHVCLYVYVL